MKISLFFLILFTLPQAFGDSISCGWNIPVEEFEKLADEAGRVSDWSIKDKAREMILGRCKSAGEEYGVVVRADKPVFTELSFTYDTSAPFYFCKNKKGYQAMLEELAKKLKLDWAKEERERYEKLLASRSNKRAQNAKRSSVKPENEQKYRCVIQGYLKTVHIVSESQKYGIEQTYNTTCTPVK